MQDVVLGDLDVFVELGGEVNPPDPLDCPFPQPTPELDGRLMLTGVRDQFLNQGILCQLLRGTRIGFITGH